MAAPRLVKVLKITGISLVSIMAVLAILPELFPGYFAKKVKALVNENIEGKLDFRRARLSIFRHFPALTLSLIDFSLMGSKPYPNDTLIAGKELAFGVDLSTLFSEKPALNEFFLTDALINIQVDSMGNGNYNVVKSTADTLAVESDSSSGASMRIKKIIIRNSRLVYNDRSLPMLIDTKEFNYTGRGDLNQDIVDLESELKANLVSFSYDGETYAKDKTINAGLVTRINTGSLELSFTKNDLHINQLPVDFKGFVRFPASGYDIDLRFKSSNVALANVLSVLPPAYLDWQKETEVKGTASLELIFAGLYRAETGEFPNLFFGMEVKDGFVKSKKAPVPVSSIQMSMKMGMPSMNYDSFYVDLDTLGLHVDKGFFRGNLHMRGLNTIYVKSNAEANTNLTLLQAASGIPGFEMKGEFAAKFNMDGTLAYGQNPDNRFADTVLVSVPKFTLDGSLENGYFKMAELPLPVHYASVKLKADCLNGKPDGIRVLADDLDVKFGSSVANGFVHYNKAKVQPIEAVFKADIQMEDIAKCIPMDGMSLGGKLHADVDMKGNFDPDRKILPRTTAQINWTDGLVKTSYYPAPIDQIDMAVRITNPTGNYSGFGVEVQPIHFEFEGQPFMVKADVKDLDNVRYNMVTKGTLDLGRISQVFVPKKYGVTTEGKIIADLKMKGSQADALAGRYHLLHNSGTLDLEDITIRSQDFPFPLVIEKGNFHADQDKLMADNLSLTYGRNKMRMKGFYQNLFPYMLGTGPLQGGLTLEADKLYLDDFLANADGSSAEVADDASPSSTGVVMLPKDLSLKLEAKVAEAQFDQFKMNDIKGSVLLDSGRMVLQGAGIRMAGVRAEMDASYEPVSATRALFDVDIKADSFDIQRFYKEVPLFAEMAPSAAKAKGQVSLKYKLDGKLDADMMPVMPSLKGGGTLSLHNIQVSGLKLFSAVAKKSGKDSISNPNLKAVNLNTKIANNVMTLERTKMRIMGFRPRMEGQATLDGKLNMKFRLGLPPLGIIGIPMTIRGTMENPKVEMRKGKEDEDLEETEDEKDGEK